MTSSARAFERMALNLSENSGGENERISTLVATAAPTCDRAQAYRMRERLALREAGLGASKKRHRERMM